MISEFRVGQHYTNDEIGISLRVANLGGIRPSVDGGRNLNHIAIMTHLDSEARVARENPYNDRIEGDILIFTGQGKSGNQTLAGGNKRICEQLNEPVPIFCFENAGRQRYIFRGLLELLRYYYEHQVDQNRDLRKVLIFEFRVHSSPAIVPITLAKALTQSIMPQSKFEEESIMEETTPPESLKTKDLGCDLIETEQARSQLLSIDPYRFEEMLKSLIELNGFRDVQVTPASQDGGIDLNAYVCEANIYFANTLVQFQAKRWRHAVGSVEINGFRGAINSMAKGVFVTTSRFTRAAIREAVHPSKPSISLIDGYSLVDLLRRSQLNLTPFF